MKRIMTAMIVLSAVSFLGGCSKPDNNPPANTASVMFMNGCAGSSGGIDILANTASAVSNQAFLANTGYNNVSTTTAVTFSIKMHDIGSTLAGGTETLVSGAHYSVFSGGNVTNSCFVFTTDDLTAPTSGAKVRLVNLSSDSLNESFYVGATKVDSNIQYKTASPFITIPAVSSLTLLAQDISQPTKIATRSSVSFDNGKIYTIVVTGSSVGSGTAGLTLSVIKNN